MANAKQLAEMRAARAKAGLVLAPPPAAEPEVTEPDAKAKTPRAVKPIPPMPVEQQPARQRKATAASEPGLFPNRVTQTLSDVQFDALDELNRTLNRQRRAAGHEQVYTVTGLIRAAIDVCMSDPRLQARMVKAAAEPRLSGRGRR